MSPSHFAGLTWFTFELRTEPIRLPRAQIKTGMARRTYGAAWAISMCKCGSDIMKMRGIKKANSGWYFRCNSSCSYGGNWGWTDNWLTLFLKWRSEWEQQIFASHFFSAQIWNVNESMPGVETFEERIFSLNMWPTQWNSLWHKKWEFWLTEFLPFLVLKLALNFKAPDN